jgi:hypothetical protein
VGKHVLSRAGLTLLAALVVAFAATIASAGSGGANLTAVGGVTAGDTYSVTSKSESGQLARTDPSLLGRTDSTPVNVMIKYDYDATASYTGGVDGLAATSPSVTGKELKDNKAAVKAYEAHTAQVSDKISAAVEQAVPSTDILGTYQTAYGGVAAQVPANQIGDVLKVNGVSAVQQDSLQQPQDDNTTFIGATQVWPTLGGNSKAGSNVIFGDIDTGVWPENPMLSQTGVAAPTTGSPPWACQFGDGTDTAKLGPTFTCNSKLIGAYAFTHTYLSVNTTDGQEFCDDAKGVCSARDSEGHGTHTTTTAAGDCVNSAVLYGVDRGPVCGIAPGAHVIEYRVCLVKGCYSSDSVAAVGQAIDDGVNVINFSISGGGNPYTDAVELAFLDAFHAGISVNASAGNSGPGAATSDHGGPWVTTVGASTGPRSFTSTLHLTADGNASLDVPGVTLTSGITSPTTVVLAATLAKAGGGNEDALCQSDLAPGVAVNKVVVCARGNNGRIDKGRRVLAGGAAGVIIYNQSDAVTDLESDNHYLPAIQTQYTVNGTPNAVATFVSTHTNVKATWAQGTASPATPDVMASFSSRGPTGDFLKPDVTAPGVQVLAGTTAQPDQTTADNGPAGNLFMAIAGTSMSSPHSAGVSILVKAAHPDWSPAEIKSALMTSSVQNVVKEDGSTPATPFDMGAGSIRADRAVNPTLVFDESYDDYAASADPKNALNRINLNIASVDAPTMSGMITAKRTATNVSGQDQDLEVTTDAPDGAQILVSDKEPQGPKKDGTPILTPKGADHIHLGKDGTTDLWITINAPQLKDGQYFGRITLDPKKDGYNAVTIPVAFVKQQGIVTLTHTCAPATIVQRTGLSHCSATVTNLGSVAANATLTVTNLDRGKGLDFTNISAPASSIRTNDGVQWSGSLTPALAPAVASINNITGNGTSPAGGYLPLAGFGGNVAIPGGDDAITNVNVPTFYYGGEAYNQIGVVTNGYIVIGGGTAADVVYEPQSFPTPARPNNVLSMFWTDLNTTGGGANGQILVNVLGDGDSDWIIVDFEGVKNFSNTTTHTGEIWIRASLANHTGPAGEELTFSYGNANAASGDPGITNQALKINWGAENRDGSSGQNISSAPANGSEYRPVLNPPTPGGHQTITYDASSKKDGTYRSDAAMTSDRTPGTTEVVQTITVTKAPKP